ncbi:NADPH-dependent F420 reductase [Hydrogenophaga sp.]|uniref:NADPH-dependent F420 reductase n=1 Tax=Hydrogenophaga sp. TaxID=1904254 RepID=UPI002721F419|nr:NADPH-dependent F420 reductase [Hydrogenophaga sp.]MDO9435935.1 NADPH-dependent F420 reductase [Hydrogenophaga sp.]
MINPSMNVSVLGGTGAQGMGLALRAAHAGLNVCVGSRDAARAQAAADAIRARVAGARVHGASLNDAARHGDLVLLTVPFSAQLETARAALEGLRGKILVDVTVPLRPPKVGRVQLPASGSCVLDLQEELGPDVRVVSAFQNVAAHALADLEHAIDCDVLVCSDDVETRATVIEFAQACGMRGLDAGPLANSAAAEALTSILIGMNRKFKTQNCGIRITGVPEP